MENNTLKETQISINIPTGIYHKNKQQEVSSQIDYTSYLISALFWSMQTTIQGYDLLDIQTDTKLFTFSEFRGHIEQLCKIGVALADQLTLYSCKVVINEKQKTEENKPLDLSESPIEDLAKSLSDLMHNPNLPKKVYECLDEQFSQIFIDTNTPENISKNLKEHLKQEGKD